MQAVHRAWLTVDETGVDEDSTSLGAFPKSHMHKFHVDRFSYSFFEEGSHHLLCLGKMMILC